MAKYISSFDLAHYSDISHDEIMDLLRENDLTSDNELIAKITQVQYESIIDIFDEVSQSKINAYFGLQACVKFQFSLFGGGTELKPRKPKTKVIPERTWEADDYLPNLEESKNYKYKFFDDLSQPLDEEIIFDIEIYGNYFLIMFLGYRTSKCWYFEKLEGQELDCEGIRWFINNHTLISFNGIKFDLPLLAIALNGNSLQDLWRVTEMLINDENGLRPYQIMKQFKAKQIECDHIDLIEIAPLKGSLKLYGARMHCPNLQDLPFKPGINLSQDQIDIVRRYCVNDVETTAYLYNKLIPQIELRKDIGKQYKTDIRSKSDAQIGELIVKSECEHFLGKKLLPNPERIIMPFKLKRYDFIKFERTDLQEIYDKICNHTFKVENGNIEADFLFNLNVEIASSTITLGIGGVHSNEKSVSYYANNDYELWDIDARGMYPSWMINRGLFPKLIGTTFIKVFKSIKQRRDLAKDTNDEVTSAAMKLAGNGTYGKTNSKYSIVYEPEMMLSTTIGGQMCILMAAERLEQLNIKIIQVNTDGICVYVKKDKIDEMKQMISQWEKDTLYEMEYTHYKSIHSRDVNNYYACKTDNKIKRKGAYGQEALSKNPHNMVCSDAVVRYLLDGTPTEEYLKSCKDIRKFLTVRNVTGGAIKDGTYLGKTVRFYHSVSTSTGLLYAKSGNAVPTSENCRPIIKLTKEFPIDVDLAWYVLECKSILKDIGVSI